MGLGRGSDVWRTRGVEAEIICSEFTGALLDSPPHVCPTIFRETLCRASGWEGCNLSIEGGALGRLSLLAPKENPWECVKKTRDRPGSFTAGSLAVLVLPAAHQVWVAVGAG